MLVLIVEDEPIVALNLLMAIEEHGHQVLGTVSSHAEVRNLLRVHHPDLALVDIHLHGVNSGIEIADDLTHEFSVPTIFLSGQQALARDHRTAALGLIEKPCVADQVAQCVDAYAQLRAGTSVTFPKALEFL